MKLRTAPKPPSQVFWSTASSPVGKVAVGMTEKNEICRLSFLRNTTIADVVAEWQSEWPQTTFSRCDAIDKVTDKQLLLVGTEFQNAVWRVMTKIPAGKTLTYGDVAVRIGNPKAVRAVGTACGANPVPYIVPCHRIVASNGLGGFSSGLEIKKMLLKAEGYNPPQVLAEPGV